MNIKKCVKFQHEVFDNLNIASNFYTRSAVFWNKYQMFFYEDLDYETLKKKSQWIYVSEFIIVQVILSSNHVICLDNCGDLYISPLKFKLKNISNFQKREKEIVGISYSLDVSFSLQKNPKGLDFCVHKISTEFPLMNKIQILHKNIQRLTNISYGKILFRTYPINETQFVNIRDKFQIQNVTWSNQIFVLISFDYLSLYAALICLKSRNQTSNLIKLYSSPSQLNNVSFINKNHLCVILGLASGTLIKITLSREHNMPDIIHLNKAIAKFVSFNETIIYSDGISLWKAEQTYSETCKTFREFIVKHVKDFVKVDDTVVCVTYSKMIYLLPFDDELSYVQIPIVAEYVPSKYMYNHAECLYQITDAISKNNSLAQEVERQKNYITALALSNRTDIVDGMVQYKIRVYDKYEDVLKDDIPLLVTSNIGEYFDTRTFYFLIGITTTSVEQKYINVLSNLFGNLQIHVTLLSEEKVLKTTSVKITEYLRELNILVPLNAEMLNLTYVAVNINLVTPVPGALNESETLWANLHHQTIILNSEHFIECDYPSKNIEYIKKPKKSIKELIFEMARNHHGQLFKINEAPKVKPINWSFLVKLPIHFEDTFSNGTYYYEIFNESKANYLLSEISSNEFLKSKNVLCWSVGNVRVYLEIKNDGFSNAVLTVTSHNPLVAFNIRNFFSNLAYSMLQNYEHEHVEHDLMEFIEVNHIYILLQIYFRDLNI